jgi:iron complex transport system permease protein
MNLKNRITFFILTLITLGIAYIHLSGGVLGFKIPMHPSQTDTASILFYELNLPRTCITILAGISLSISGLLMQTYFNNPLAGPSMLGITAGSSLFVAISLMTGLLYFKSTVGLVSAAIIGAFIFSCIILVLSYFIKSQLSILIIGIMISSFTSSMIQFIESTSEALALKQFTIWGFGSLQKVYLEQLPFIICIFSLSLFLVLFLIKPLNTLVLGEQSAAHLGINLKKTRLLIIICITLFTGTITAFCGPIAFIGLAVPNMVKILFKTTNHLILIVGCIFTGAIVLLSCDLCIIWLEPFFQVPLNSITSFVGAPIVVWIILKNRIHA